MVKYIDTKRKQKKREDKKYDLICKQAMTKNLRSHCLCEVNDAWHLIALIPEL